MKAFDFLQVLAQLWWLADWAIECDFPFFLLWHRYIILHLNIPHRYLKVASRAMKKTKKTNTYYRYLLCIPERNKT
jgi:hypothetical protein